MGNGELKKGIGGKHAVKSVLAHDQSSWTLTAQDLISRKRCVSKQDGESELHTFGEGSSKHKEPSRRRGLASKKKGDHHWMVVEEE